MADRDGEAGLGRERGQFCFPEPVAVAVRPARIGGDEQPGSVGVVGVAAGVPPAADRGDRERRGVMVDPTFTQPVFSAMS